jgi:hypothetical protein
MRIRISAAEEPLTVQFEPSGMEYELPPGDHMDVEFPPAATGEPGGYLDHAPGMVTVSASAYAPGFARAWNADGEEVTT